MTEAFEKWVKENYDVDKGKVGMRDINKWLSAFVKEVERRRADWSVQGDAFYSAVRDFGLDKEK